MRPRPTRADRRRAAIRPAVFAVTVAGLVLAGCADPGEDTAPVATSSETAPTREPTATVAPVPSDTATDEPTTIGSPSENPQVGAVAQATIDVRTSLSAARDALDAAREALATEEPVAARAAGELAVHLLTAAPELAVDLDGDGTRPEPDVAPLFPGPEISREETVDYGDTFSMAMAVGRDGGGAGAALLGVLRDPIAGDLGFWQRDPQAQLDLIDDAGRPTDDLDAAQAAVDALDGDAGRALAWSLLLARSSTRTDPSLMLAFADRGMAHLSLCLDALDRI